MVYSQTDIKLVYDCNDSDLVSDVVEHSFDVIRPSESLRLSSLIAATALGTCKISGIVSLVAGKTSPDFRHENTNTVYIRHGNTIEDK